MAEEAETTAAETQTTETKTVETTKTFTPEQQAIVDKIVQDRLARAKNEPPADYAEAKAALAKLAEIEAASLSDLEKANKAREEAEQKSAQAIETANRRLVEAAVLAAATAEKAVKPEHLHKLIDATEVKVDDDGQVVGAVEAVKAFLDANPEYVGTRAAGDADQGARGNGTDQITRDALKAMSPDEISKALAEGRLSSLTGG